jgi:hypothetical protein
MQERVMMQWRYMSVACFVVLLAIGAVPVQGGGLPAGERAKIEALIQYVEHQTDAVFIRNNKAYPATIAARFLRDKWAASLEEIGSAQEFIEKIASVSSTSGQPYRIRFTDGYELLSGEYLRAALQHLEQ